MAITNFVPELWSPLILANLWDKLVYGSAAIINRDYEGVIANAGDTVHITSFTDPAVRAYTKNNDITYDLLTDSTQALVVDQSDYFAFTVDDVDRRQALPGFVAKASAGAAQNLAINADTYLSGVLYAGVNGTSNDLGAKTADISDNTAYAIFVDLRTTLTRAKVPNEGRWVVVPPELYAALLQDARFINASASADSGAALRNGFVGRIAGFDVYESNTVPEETTGVYSVIAGHPMACTVAEQITETEAIRLQEQFGDGIRGLHLYGAEVIEADALAMASVTIAA
jgi:hypothetical protein